MRSYMERVIAEIPLFFSHFSQCLFRPKRFIQQQLAIAEQPDDVSKGVEFLILSFLIALFISQLLPEAVNPTASDALQQQLAQAQSLYLQATKRPLFLLGSGYKLVCSLFWPAGCLLPGLPTVSSNNSVAVKLSFPLLSLVFVYAASLLLSLMQTGSQMMALYRACPPS